MKKIKLSTLLLFMAMLSLTFVSCIKVYDDNDKDNENENEGGIKSEAVTIGEDGKASGGHIFSAVDDKNFFIDYIKYSVVSDHLEVTGHDKAGLKGAAMIVSQVNYKGHVFKVLAIGDKAFRDNKSLTSVSIPNSVTTIREYAFEESSITSINIPNSVTSIEYMAFSYCTSLASVTIGSSVTNLNVDAFAGCCIQKEKFINNSKLNAIEHDYWGATIYDYITDVFMICDNVLIKVTDDSRETYTIPNSVTSIGDRAFFDCLSLTSVTIGNSVTNIGEYAFSFCPKLTSVTIPNSVTSIGESTFSHCSGLTSVTIGNSVKSIGYWAFRECSNLTTIHCLAKEVPSADSHAFDNYSICTLYVPKESVEKYKSASPWKNFKAIIGE